MEKQSSAHQQNGGEGSRRLEDQVLVDIATLQGFSKLLQSQLKKPYSESRRRRQIQKLPPQMRRRNLRPSQQVYDPVMVSIGPYHHDKPGLRRAKEFKHLCLDRCAAGDKKKKAFFYSKVLEEVDAVRASYAEAKILEKYDDKSLALMMLLDASIIIDFIHNHLGMKGNSFLDWKRCLGAGSGPLMVHDMILMENQIPFYVLQLVISLQNEEGEAASFFPRFFAGLINKYGDITLEMTQDPPIHLFEASWRVLVRKYDKHRHKHTVMSERSSVGKNAFLMCALEETADADISYTHRSAMDLKAKGIRVRPHPDLSFTGITFEPGACFSQLRLQFQHISDLTPVIAANMIAFAVLPNGCSSLVVLSYIIFMKSLVQSPEDVKELQDNGVMLNRTANLEKVVEVFKEIDTFGLHDQDIFKDVKMRIEEHCSNRARTWLAELIYTRFRTPWTAIALLGAVLLLSLTFLQTFFTIRPNNVGAHYGALRSVFMISKIVYLILISNYLYPYLL